MSLHDLLNPWSFVSAAECLISAGIGISGFCLAFALKKQGHLQGVWYTSLRWILTALSISGISNAWSLILLESVHAKPTELFVNSTLLLLLMWIGCFYRLNLVKRGGSTAFSKALKFLHDEFTGSPSARE